jgi:ABC-type Na+ efflux pump permease subunit
MSNYNTVYKSVQKQNKILESNIRDINEKFSTDDQKSIYTHQKLSVVKNIYFVLFIIYYIVLLMAIYVIFFRLKTINSIYSKLFIVVLLVLAPFIIIPIEIQLYKLLIYSYNTITSNVNVTKPNSLPPPNIQSGL